VEAEGESVAGRETTLSLRSNAATQSEQSSRNGTMRIDPGSRTPIALETVITIW
jgi:hypothetical protein